MTIENTTPESDQCQLQSGAERSPDRWLDDHGDLLFRFAFLRVRNRHIAEELVQDTLLNAFNSLATFRGQSSVRTWLIAILRNEIAKYFRKSSREQAVAGIGEKLDTSSQLDQLLSPRIDPQQFLSAVERSEFWNIVQQRFDKVPDHLLEAFLFRLANQDARIEELCNELEIKPSNFSVRVFRTRLMLRACLEKHWLDNETHT